MTKKYSQTRRIIIFVLSLLFVASIGLCLMQNKGYANADEYQLTTSIELADRYFEGDVVKIPTAKFSNGTKEVEAEYTVKYPDGSERIATEVELATSGTYTIAYKALVDGKWLTENVTFDAVQKLFGVDNPTGSSEIQEYIFDDTATKKGLMTVIPAGSNFVYNKVINLNERTKDDILFDANIISSKTGKFDFMQFNLRLTDVYDSSNYITFEIFCTASDNRGSYMRGCASVQGKATSNSHSDRNGYGVYSFCSFTNLPSGNYTHRSNDTVQFAFDYENQTLYGNRYTPQNGMKPIPVISLNDTSRFSVMWDGFTTGEVILSVYPTLTDSSNEATKKELTGAGQATLLINSIDGDDVDTIADNYSFKDNYYKDDVNPVLDVDLGEYTEESLPEAVVGYPYPVYPAKTEDVGSGIRSFSTKVFLGYTTNNPTVVSIKDGKFTPRYRGNYTIEYKSVDYFGNTSIELVNVRCVDDQGYAIELKEDGSTSFVTGNVIKIKSPDTVNQSGTSSITAVVEGKDEKGVDVVYPISMEELTFIPMNSGEYTVKYTASDYVGREIYAEYVINVEKAEKPVFIEKPEFIKNFVQGFDYVIPAAKAFDFHAGKYVDSKIFYKEGIDGEEKELTSATITPTILESLEDFTLYLRYEATAERDASLVEKLEYEINCASVYLTNDKGKQVVDRKTLFDVTENVTVDYAKLNQNSELSYAKYSALGDAKLSYINPISAIDFSTYFALVTNDFTKLVFTLTDVEDANNAIQLVVESNDGQSVKVTPTGGLQVTVKNMTFYNINHTYNVKYEFDTNSFQLADGKDRFIVKKNLAGKDFAGFTTNKVYLDIELLNVTAGKTAELVVTEVNGFYLFDRTFYETSVLVKIDFDFNQPQHIDVETVIPHAVILDAVDGGITATMTLKTPSGAVVETVDGIKLENVDPNKDYTVIFKEYGKYALSYKVKGFGTIRELITVEDIKRPTLTITDALKTEVAVGTTIKLDATAVDDSGKDTRIVLAVFGADYQMQALEVGSDFTFDKAGKYIIIFTAYDEAGNCTISRNVIKVK